MFDIFSMMGKVKEAQEKMKVTQENLVHLVTTAESGAGLVKATINGHRKIIKLEIDTSIMNDRDMIQDLSVAAINKALDDVDALIKQEMKKSMEGMIPNIPGLDLESFLR
ncbi:MAG: YbaB/EbfC family nucleoid-associated protein [Bacteroidota bacterium]|nr:YbaB/EbfC family nucleoid-associated protein [Bacteroidota bacterium]